MDWLMFAMWGRKQEGMCLYGHSEIVGKEMKKKGPEYCNLDSWLSVIKEVWILCNLIRTPH